MIYVIEEHNEAFYIINKYVNSENNILVHVDEHHDLAPAYLDCELLNNKDYKRITYDNLRISDYILALCAFDKISEVYWINNKDKHINTIKSVENIDILNYKMYYLSDSINKEYIKIKSSNIGMIRNNLIYDKSKEYILSIDLDYFCPNNLKGETYTIPITEGCYDDFIVNKYNKIRLNYGSKAKVHSRVNKFYLEICELDGEYNGGKYNKDDIDKKIMEFLYYLKSTDINFNNIIICKSKLSSFTDEKYVDYVYKKVERGLRKIYGINESVYIGEIND